MPNPIADLLAKASPMGQALTQASGMAQAMQSGSPMGMLMGQNNPQMKQAMDYIQSCGGDAKQAFFNLAKQRGVDPNAIIGQAKSMLNNK